VKLIGEFDVVRVPNEINRAAMCHWVAAHQLLTDKLHGNAVLLHEEILAFLYLKTAASFFD
jgi:hypothetical protein